MRGRFSFIVLSVLIAIGCQRPEAPVNVTPTMPVPSTKKDKTLELAKYLQEGMRAVTVYCEDVGSVTPEARVDVVVKETANGKDTSRVLVEDVLVLAINVDTNDPRRPGLATLALMPAPAEQVIRITKGSERRITLVVRKPEGK
jgi:Flp pilus assembly protein CpaB